MQLQKDKIKYYQANIKENISNGDLTKAKNYLKELYAIEPDNLALYYIYYKVNVREGEFTNAFLNLYGFKLISLEKHNANVDLPLTLLEMYYDLNSDYKTYQEKNYQVPFSNMYVTYNIKDDKLIKIYHEIIECFNNKCYYEMPRKIKEMNQYIKDNNYQIEVETLKIIVDKIIMKLAIKNNNLCYLLGNDEYYYSTKSYLEDILKKDFPNLSIIPILQSVNDLIDKDITKTKEIVNLVKNPKYSLYTNCLKNKIREKELFDTLTDSEKESCNKLFTLASSYIESEKYEEAYDCYHAIRYISNNPLLIFYEAKMLYEQEKEIGARELFEEYKKQGGSKLVETDYYLILLYANSNNNYFMRQIHGIKDEKYKLDRLFNYDFKYMKPQNYFSDSKVEDWLTVEHMVTLLNTHKKVPKSYDKCIGNKKFSYIKMQIENGRIDFANKLLKDLEKDKDVDHRKIEQFQRNKTLYKNKRKGVSK